MSEHLEEGVDTVPPHTRRHTVLVCEAAQRRCRRRMLGGLGASLAGEYKRGFFFLEFVLDTHHEKVVMLI